MTNEWRKTEHDFESEHASSQDVRLILEEPCGVETGQGMRVTRVRTRHAHSSSLSRTRLVLSHTRSATCVHTYVDAYVHTTTDLRSGCDDATRVQRDVYTCLAACHALCTDTELTIGDDCRTPTKLPGKQQERQGSRSRNFTRLEQLIS